MSFKHEVQEEVPERFHTNQDFRNMLRLIEEEQIKNRAELKKYLEEETRKVEEVLDDHKSQGKTNVSHVREDAAKLNYLKRCQDIMEEHLR